MNDSQAPLADSPTTTDSDGQPSDSRPPASRARALTKVYGQGEIEVTALDAVDVDIEAGRFTAVMGPSGSGKSTLMHCLAGLDTITSGEVFLGETALSGLSDTALTKLRRSHVGFVFQAFNLIPTLSAQENITLPQDIAGKPVDSEWFDKVVSTLDLEPRLKHKPSELSGGQQQRVAAARAMVARPQVIFADEPTGNLDSKSGAELLAFLRQSVVEHDQTIVMVTHDPRAASYADRVLFLADGKIVNEMTDPTADLVLQRMGSLEAPQDS